MTTTLFFASTSASLSVLIPRMLLSMTIVIACMWLAARFLQKRGTNFSVISRRNMQQQPFEVLSKYTIGKRQSLLVTRHNTRVFLLGVTDSSITLITELDNTDDIDISSVAETQRTDVSAQQFPAWKDLLAQAKERTVRNAR